MNKRSSQKLSKRFFGPFKVLDRIGPVAYHLDLPPDSRIHPVVHISLLRPFYGEQTQILPQSLPTDSEPEEDLEEEDSDLNTDMEKPSIHNGGPATQPATTRFPLPSHAPDKDSKRPRDKPNLEDKVFNKERSIDSMKCKGPNKSTRETNAPVWMSDYYRY